MMINKDEKRLLLSIKIIPLVIFSVIAVVGTLIALYLIHMNFDNEIAKVKSVYLKQQKKVIKQEVVKIRNNIQNEKKLTEEKLKENIKSYVHSAYAIVNNIYEQNKDKSEEQILKMAKDALRDIRFNDNRGYFFMYKMDGKVLLLPTNKNFEGKNFINLKDAKGKYTVRDMRDLTLKNGESFYTWWWYKPNETEFQSKKIGFAKYFEPLDCFIGTGEYVKDFEETVKKSITKRLSLYTYGKDSYIFIFNKYGKILAHKDQKLIGKTSLVYQGIENKTLTQDMVEVSKGEGNFYKYTYLNNKGKTQTEKISFLIQCDEWDWTIGSGFYTDDLNMIIEQKTKELTRKNDDNIRTIIIIFCVLIIIVILLSLLLSYAIKQRFEHYKTKVKEKDQLLFQQSKMAAMGEMIENIAHQWRQPLSIISTASSGLKVQQEYSMMTKELLNNGLDNISESVEYLSQTIDDFRNFYKEDKLKKSFNISQTIQKAIHLLHSRFKKKNIELVVQKSEVELYGLQNELMQVFMNILNNARDVLENMELERKLIFVNVKKLENSIKISFYDNGNGVDEEIISKLFDYKFTTKEQQNGTGVGLYMSKLIVEKSGGTIEVHNKEYEYQGKNYKGAEFIITLTF